jgi:hypothetical protein
VATSDGDSTVFFEEIDGDRRKVYLRGSLSPHGGPRRDAAFKLGGGIRQSKQPEPGVRPPVRHITGTTENDIELHGHFRDALIGSDGAADALQELIDDIRKQARSIRLVWKNKIRIGILAKADFGVEGWRDRTYQLTFEIDGDEEGEAATRERLKRVAFPPANTAGLLDDLQTKVQAVIKVPGLSFDVGGWLTDLYAGLSGPLFDMLGALEDIEADIDDVSGALHGIVNSAKAFLARIDHLAGTLDGESDPTDLDDASAMAAWQRARAEALVALQVAAKRVFDLGVEAERRIARAIAAGLHIVTDGETLEQIAAREGIDVMTLRSMNPGIPLMPAAGTKVKLP